MVTCPSDEQTSERTGRGCASPHRLTFGPLFEAAWRSQPYDGTCITADAPAPANWTYAGKLTSSGRDAHGFGQRRGQVLATVSGMTLFPVMTAETRVALGWFPPIQKPFRLRLRKGAPRP